MAETIIGNDSYGKLFQNLVYYISGVLSYSLSSMSLMINTYGLRRKSFASKPSNGMSRHVCHEPYVILNLLNDG